MVHLLDDKPETGHKKTPTSRRGFGSVVGVKSIARVDLNSPDGEIFCETTRGATLRSSLDHELRCGNCQLVPPVLKFLRQRGRLDQELQIESGTCIEDTIQPHEKSPIAASLRAQRQATTSTQKKPGSVEPGLRYWPC
jgi:hypothetical protein